MAIISAYFFTNRRTQQEFRIRAQQILIEVKYPLSRPQIPHSYETRICGHFRAREGIKTWVKFIMQVALDSRESKGCDAKVKIISGEYGVKMVRLCHRRSNRFQTFTYEFKYFAQE
jgi:hypothetical protein